MSGWMNENTRAFALVFAYEAELTRPRALVRVHRRRLDTNRRRRAWSGLSRREKEPPFPKQDGNSNNGPSAIMFRGRDINKCGFLQSGPLRGPPDMISTSEGGVG